MSDGGGTGWRQWIGRTEVTEDVIDPRRCAQLAGTLGRKSVPDVGELLPLPWHWTFFTPIPQADATGRDGHPARGGFLPPVDLPRRMWAGGRVWVHGALRVGERAVRESRIADITVKQGSQGGLVFVLVEHRYTDPAGSLLLREEQDIVYRDPPAAGVRPREQQSPGASQWSRTVGPDPVLLFRYAALTFNAHRIHYDRDWAVAEEGYPGLVVQGPLTASLLLDLLSRKVPDPQVTEFSFRGLSPLFDRAPFELHGAVREGEASLWAQTPENTLAMTVDCKLAPGIAGR